MSVYDPDPMTETPRMSEVSRVRTPRLALLALLG
jgi:hypothetical protein